MTYKFIEDIAIADIAFEATGKDLQELFQSAAEAVIDSFVNTDSVKPAEEIKIEKKAENIDKLLFEFLEEIIFIKDKDAIVFHDVAVEVDEKTITAKATLHGDKINREEQELLHDVKAVTMHYWNVEKTEQGWKANVVLDI